MPSTHRSDGGHTVYHQLLSTIIDSSFWYYPHPQNLDDRITTAITTGDPAIRLMHPTTSATLEVEYTPTTDTFATLALNAALDPTLESKDAYFAGSLALTHKLIGASHQTPHLTPHADPIYVLTAPLSPQTTTDELTRILSAITTTSHAIDALHTNICSPLKQYVHPVCTSIPPKPRDT
ncbi:hypothetical protein [Salarchaeum sp. JOR-1]|uniref:hypothetical protein n=1 Tax=Salarchaeum sp. JOR-1 TaxID=2599399 RepID=UPI001198769C|nr:hypothetical protein [Salarchaeum sp. JOR-1]QDX39349.1 hypothetical protein FQU85_00010 [Salarchaeum sp. JOR-1]